MYIEKKHSRREESRSHNEVAVSMVKPLVPAIVVEAPVVSPERSRALQVLGRIARILIALFEGGRMVREVGPGIRPLERHEFENSLRDRRHIL